MKIYTIGHSNLPIEQLIKTLKKYEIGLLIDVRRFPSSRKYPWYNKETLKEKLEINKIKYLWLGENLGGYRKEGYIEYMKTKKYKQGIKELMNISKKYITAIMCSEKLWFKCHRRYISDTLTKKNITIIHIINGKRETIHKLRQ